MLLGMTRVSMTEEEFDRLIDRYQRGLCSSREEELIDRWFEAKHQDDFRWSAADAEQHLAGIHARLGVSGTDAAFYRRSWLKVAASVLIFVACLWGLLHYSFQRDTMVVASREGEVFRAILPDGTLVWLKGASRLTYNKDLGGDRRDVMLEGEALFEVVKDPARPFVIHAGDFNAAVLGTSFHLKTGVGEVSLTVLTGRVALSSNRSSVPVTVTAGESIVYTGSAAERAVVVPEEEKSRVVEGTSYVMVFDNDMMVGVSRRLEAKFGKQVIMGEAIGRCLITADFTDQSLDDTLRILAHIVGFDYEVDGDVIRIYGDGC